MKVIIPQKMLLESLKRGAYAALSDEAQSDASTLSSLVKSVKIKVAENEILFESATSLVASQYSEAVTDKIKVQETGDAMVLAKEMFEWVDRQGDCMIKLDLKKFEAPKMVNYATGDVDGGSRASIKKTGMLKLTSQDTSKTGSKWSLDSYDEGQVPFIDYKRSADPLFVAPLKNLAEGLKNISFVAMSKDADHLFDTISFQHKDEEMYMLTSDCARCALWRLLDADKITMKNTLTAEKAEKQEMEGAWKHNILVSTKILGDMCKLASDMVPLAFYRDENKNHIYVSQPGFVVRMATAEKEAIEKYPPLDLFLVKKFDLLCTVSGGVMASRLKTVSLVNQNSILFDFQDEKLILQGVSESGQAPCKATANVSNLAMDFKQVWNVQHFLDILKSLKNDDMKISVPANRKKNSIKISIPSVPNVAHYVMAIERHKYDLTGE